MAQRKTKRPRLNELDFWEALSRSEAYRQDSHILFSKPFDALRAFGKDRAKFDRIDKAMVPLGDASLVTIDAIPKIIEKLKAGNRPVHRVCATLHGYHENDRIAFIKNARFILVEIDLWAQKTRIEKEVWELVRDLRNCAKPSSRGASSLETGYNEEVWQIYDAVKGGKPIYQLARERLRARFPANTDRIEKLLPAEDRKLRRYFKKADSMIRQVYAPK